MKISGRRSAVAATVAAMVCTGWAAHGVAGDKSAAARSENSCVFTSTLDDYQPLDNERLLLWAPGRKQPYLVTLNFPSMDLKWGIQLGFEDHDRNGLICGFGSDAVVIRGAMPDRITIRSMERITPDEAKQLLASSRKRLPPQPSPESSR